MKIQTRDNTNKRYNSLWVLKFVRLLSRLSSRFKGLLISVSPGLTFLEYLSGSFLNSLKKNWNFGSSIVRFIRFIIV